MSGQADKLLGTDGSSASWVAPGGDLSGTPSAMTVTRIQGRAVAATAPAEGQALVWSAGSSQWQPAVAGASLIAGQAQLDFAPFYDGCCSSLTFTVSGAAISDGVAAAWPPALESGLVGMMRVSAVNTVK